MTFFAHGGISTKNFVMYVHIINKTLSHKFHPYSLFNFEYVNEVWMSGVLCVKSNFQPICFYVSHNINYFCGIISRFCIMQVISDVKFQGRGKIFGKRWTNSKEVFVCVDFIFILALILLKNYILRVSSYRINRYY